MCRVPFTMAILSARLRTPRRAGSASITTSSGSRAAWASIASSSPWSASTRIAASQPLARERQLRGQGHQVLLHAVVQVTLDALALGVLGLRHPRPRRGQLHGLLPDK